MPPQPDQPIKSVQSSHSETVTASLGILLLFPTACGLFGPRSWFYSVLVSPLLSKETGFAYVGVGGSGWRERYLQSSARLGRCLLGRILSGLRRGVSGVVGGVLPGLWVFG